MYVLALGHLNLIWATKSCLSLCQMSDQLSNFKKKSSLVTHPFVGVFLLVANKCWASRHCRNFICMFLSLSQCKCKFMIAEKALKILEKHKSRTHLWDGSREGIRIRFNVCVHLRLTLTSEFVSNVKNMFQTRSLHLHLCLCDFDIDRNTDVMCEEGCMR